MTIGRLRTLRLIKRSTTVTIRDVVSELRITERAAAQRLDKLYRTGLVKKEGEGQRVAGSPGRPIIFYSLTPEGEKKLAYWNQHLEDIDGQND
jgi:predicted ArsR family transcriptional regulator